MFLSHGAERQRQESRFRLNYEQFDRCAILGKQKRGIRQGTRSPAVDETGLPRTARHLLQCSDVDMTQFDTSLCDTVARMCGIDVGVFHFLNIWSVRRTEFGECKSTHLDKVPQLFSDFFDQLRSGDPFWLSLVIYDPDLKGSLINPFT